MQLHQQQRFNRLIVIGFLAVFIGVAVAVVISPIGGVIMGAAAPILLDNPIASFALLVIVVGIILALVALNEARPTSVPNEET